MVVRERNIYGIPCKNYILWTLNQMLTLTQDIYVTSRQWLFSFSRFCADEIVCRFLITLLNATRVQLKVREHPSFGPYVEGLSSHAVKSYDDISSLLNVGNKRRATAATGMNDTSSRSHSVFSLLLTITTVSGARCDGCLRGSHLFVSCKMWKPGVEKSGTSEKVTEKAGRK